METSGPSEHRRLSAFPGVAVIVLARRPGDPTSVFSSIEAQVYEPVAMFVVSDDRPKANIAAPHARWAPSVQEAIASLDAGVDYVWILDREAVPHPDALEALVATATRTDASVVGSKLLNAERNEELVSVGGATDVFGYPFTGIEQGEVDQEQYDVIRDVAYVEPASMLVRRDLAAGLGGLDPLLPQLSAGLDFCQRARLAGGRVVVAPTSEVDYGHSDPRRPLTWREQAGRVRVMIKSYSMVTLAWAIPGLFAMGLLLSFYRTFNGHPLAVGDWARAWLWNVIHLPSTVTGRRKARASRLAGDEELFRFQVRGSVEVRAVASEVGALLQDESGDDDPELVGTADQSPGFWQQPAFLAAVFGSVFVAAFTRGLWSEGMPASGFVLPLGDSAWNTLRAYAGGWHLGGLGSPEPMHPSIAATSAVQLLFGSRASLAAVTITVAAVALGIAGTTRLVRRMGLGHASRYLAGVVFVAGSPMLAIAESGYWPALLAAAGLPWVLAGVVQPLPGRVRFRVGRIASMVLGLAWTTMMLPSLIVVPLGFAVAWSFATRKIGPLARAGLVTVLTLPMLFPWLSVQTAASILTDGAPFHFDPTWWVMGPVLVAGLAVVLAAKGNPARVAVLGTLGGAIGFFASRASDLGAGRDLTAAGGVVAAMGVALVIAGAFDALDTVRGASMIRRSVVRLGIAGAVGSVLLVLGAIPSGRAGLPADEWGTLAFADSRAGSHGTDRLLLIGPGTNMPGEFRRLDDGTAYRLIGGFPTFEQAWLPNPRLGDEALASTLENLADGSELRPGEALAAFGVRWVVFTGESVLSEVMTAQLDLRPLPQLVYEVYESEIDGFRAVTDSGFPWTWESPDYVGRAGEGTVRIAENADPRWGPDDWQQRDWANEVSTTDGLARFGGVAAFRLQARLAGLLALILLAASLAGRPSRSSRVRR